MLEQNGGFCGNIIHLLSQGSFNLYKYEVSLITNEYYLVFITKLLTFQISLNILTNFAVNSEKKCFTRLISLI